MLNVVHKTFSTKFFRSPLTQVEEECVATYYFQEISVYIIICNNNTIMQYGRVKVYSETFSNVF